LLEAALDQGVKPLIPADRIPKLMRCAVFMRAGE